MGNTTPNIVKTESYVLPRYIDLIDFDSARISLINFESYCENVGISYDTNGNQISKKLTRHELRISEINLRQKYKDVETKINFLREVFENIDPSFLKNNDIRRAHDFLIELDKKRLSGIYHYKSGYINALKRLGVP